MTQAPLAEEIGQLLRRGKRSLAVAESCTGGLLGYLITSVPGSSDYFLGGIIAYSNAAKISALGVTPQTLDTHGAVSQATALAMADGARVRFESDFALSITGIAGPGGGLEGKPVGLTWIGLSSTRGSQAREHLFDHDRSGNQHAAAQAALQLLADELARQPPGPGAVEVRGQAGGYPHVTAFEWQGTRYTVTETGRRWEDSGRLYQLVRTSPPGVFELSCSEASGDWELKPRTTPPAVV